MQRTHDLRRKACFAGALFTVVAASLGAHGQTLPATPPTALPGQTLPGQTTPGTPAAVTPPPNPPHHAEVRYVNGQIQVRANNSSLNQILRSISHLTGLKITGGVEEQRVFGNYGPGPLSTVLATLIDGTGANILLLGGDANTPPELILTSRSGGPEPPGPDSAAYAMYDDNNNHEAPLPPTAPHTESLPTQPHVNVAPPTSAPPAPSASTPSKPLTPEMVEQELLQMQAQQDLKKRQLDEKIQQQQIDQQKKLQKVTPQNPPSQPPANSNPQQ
jgi:hypothetical protein